MFWFPPLHRRDGELLLVHRLGVTHDLSQAGVARDGCDLMRGTSRLSQPPRCRLSQAMRAAMVQARFVALLAEPMAKASLRERTAILRCQKRQGAPLASRR